MKPYGMIHFEVRFIGWGWWRPRSLDILSDDFFTLLQQLELKFWEKEAHFFSFSVKLSDLSFKIPIDRHICRYFYESNFRRNPSFIYSSLLYKLNIFLLCEMYTNLFINIVSSSCSEQINSILLQIATCNLSNITFDKLVALSRSWRSSFKRVIPEFTCLRW